MMLRCSFWRRGQGGAEGDREGESQAGPTPSAEPDTGLHLMTLRSRPEPKSRVGRETDGAAQEPWKSQ